LGLTKNKGVGGPGGDYTLKCSSPHNMKGALPRPPTPPWPLVLAPLRSLGLSVGLGVRWLIRVGSGWLRGKGREKMAEMLLK